VLEHILPPTESQGQRSMPSKVSAVAPSGPQVDDGTC
jgi:hypothetical protein